MFNRLHIRIIIGLGAVLILFGIASQLIQQASTVACIQEVHQKMHHDLAKTLVETWLDSEGPNLKKGRISGLFKEILEANPQLTIYLLNAKGEIVCSSSMETLRSKNITLQPISTFLDADATLPIYGPDPRKDDISCLFSVAPIADEGGTVGYLYVLLEGDEENSIAKLASESNVMWLSSASTIIGLALVMVVGTLLITRSTSRVRTLADQMETFRSSGFTRADAFIESGESNSNEIGRLERVSREMAEKIAAQINELQRAGEFRRELVTNVGHDLRTPLSSLLGYLESIKLKDDKLTQKERENFLNVALSNAQHLSSIVEELNDLSRLDSGDIQLSTEDITVQDLLNDAILTHQEKFNSRGISFDVEMTDKMINVTGDPGFLGRAFSYIIKHMIRNTSDGAGLEVQLRENENTVEIVFHDPGRFVPQQELIQLFERFHQEEGNPQAVCGGTGMAITGRIISLHGGSIRAESTRESGTRIIIELFRN